MRVSAGSAFFRQACAALLCLGAIWAVAVPAAPWLVQADESRTAQVGGAIVYEFGARICHQRPDRSFASAGLQWPVCGRCAGLYLTFGAAALAVWGARPLGSAAARLSLPSWRVALIAALLPIAISWVLERLPIAVLSPLVRAWLAAPAGATIALLLFALRARCGRRPEVD